VAPFRLPVPLKLVGEMKNPASVCKWTCILTVLLAAAGCQRTESYDQRLRSLLAQADRAIAAGPFQDSWESLAAYRVPAWYEDGKFGIFIHWGVYSVPAFDNEWYPRNMYLESSPVFEHHVKTYGPQIKFGYKDFIPRFTAARFDPDQWAQIFKRAGARFVVMVAEHHDGFSLYDNSLSEWNAVNMGPKRDLLSLVAGAVRRHGMVFGASSHRAEHWWFFEGGMQFASDVSEPRNSGLYSPAFPRKTSFGNESQPDPAFLNDWLARAVEIVEKYRPQIVYFDWWIEQPVFEPYRRKFAAYYYNRAAAWKRGVVINYKLGSFRPGTAVETLERGRSDVLRPNIWQVDTSISKRSWGYIENDEFRTAGAIIDDLVDAVSKNGVMLLNIGPRADGTLPEEAVRVLLETGRWLEVNGEAIYGTRPWRIFGEGPTQAAGGSFQDKEQPPYTGEDFRFTTRGNVLYAIALGWPENGRFLIRSLAAGSPHLDHSIASVELLGSPQRVNWRQTPEGLVVESSSKPPVGNAYVLRIRLAGP